jgi:hypothetical protein
LKDFEEREVPNQSWLHVHWELGKLLTNLAAFGNLTSLRSVKALKEDRFRLVRLLSLDIRAALGKFSMGGPKL